MSETTERLTPQFSSQLAQTLSVRNDRLFIAMALLAIAPLWFGQNLPMIDMPQHAAQIAALREIWSGNQTFSQLFVVNWFTPYLAGYLLLYGASLVMPIGVASQLIVSLSLLAIPLLTGRLLRVAGADERWKWLAIPCCYGFAFYWGFLSFLVAAPFALLFLIQSIRFSAEPTLRRGLGIAAFAIALFFCHVIVLGYASMLALGYIAGAHFHKFKEQSFAAANFKTLVLRALPYTAPIPLIGVWLFITYTSVDIVRSDPVVFGPVMYRLIQLIVQPAGRDSFEPFICLLIGGSVAVLPLLMGSQFSRRPERWMPFALGLLVFLIAPHYVLSTAYFYQRLGLFLVPLWLLVWDAPSTEMRRPDWVVMPIVLIWAFMNTGRYAAFAKETESFDAVLGAMEPGKRVASLVVDKASPLFSLPVYLHFPAWYQAKKGGIVDFNFADFYSQMARYKPDAGPRIAETPTWYPQLFDWQEHGGAKYDYFLIKANADVSEKIFKAKRGSVELVGRSEWWWLYRNVEKNSGLASHDRQ